MIHLALDGPAPWAAGDDIAGFAYVHIAPDVETLARTYRQSRDGLLPDSPLLIVGQTTAVDPSRAPAGTHVLWVQVRTLPREIEGDAAGRIEARSWSEAAAPFAERVLDKLERYAPGIRDRIVGQAVLSPADLEASNACLVGGDSLGGSLHLRQNFLFRPFPGWSRYETPVRDLWACGASTWPGPGNNGTSGWLAAGRMLGPSFAPAALGAAAAGAGAALWATLRGENE
jgi:phytoene dehydrogenase-like protein